MKPATRNPQSAIALTLAFLAAIVVLLAAWLLPLPRLVLSDEEDAAKRMPQTVVDVDRARSAFEQSQQSYQGYVATHDVGAALNSLDSAIQQVQADPTDNAVRTDLHAAAQAVSGYLVQLRDYLQSGEAYFGQLSHFDNELMAWTRSLGTSSEVLRPDTWPIVEYLKLYPPPTGLKADYTSFDVSDLQGIIDALSADTASVDPGMYAAMLTDVREAGRSIEYTESLNPGYATLLQNYHARLQVIASSAGTGIISADRALIATVGNTILAILVVVGLASLFFSRKSAINEALP
jgi:hypothetical protein